jgi:uncharacterized protein YqfA (UPF0365 family)
MDNFGWSAPLAVFAIFVALVGLAVLFMFARYFKLWLRGFVSRARIGPFALIGMSLRKVNPQVVTETKIMAVQAGLTDITTNAIEAHYLAGGNIRRVVQALIAAHRARIELNWDTAAAIDLAGRNVLEAVQTSVDPKVIDCPDPRRTGRTTLDGVAKDGIQLKARARVTVRTNLAQLVGGATEETVIARVGEGIVSAIGSCASHKDVLANPTLIAKAVLDKGLDSQTAYEIVSIDIADISVGDNLGARLMADQAEADMRIARAKAEERRANAVAKEQEMQALTKENQAAVVMSEAEIPKALAEAYRMGTLRAYNAPNGAPHEVGPAGLPAPGVDR